MKAIELQLLDALQKAEPELRIMQRLRSPASFVGLNDNIIDAVQFSSTVQLRLRAMLALHAPVSELVTTCLDRCQAVKGSMAACCLLCSVTEPQRGGGAATCGRFQAAHHLQVVPNY